MTKSNKLPIFLSYSFEKTPPKWSPVSDIEVEEWFEKLLKSHGFKVLSGRKAESRPMLDKIFESVDQSKAIIAIFTGKFKIDTNPNRYLPSPWVLCECAYAQGRFRDAEYIIAGFREKGVAVSDLASITGKNMEIPEFEREHLDRDKDIFVGYLRDLEQRLVYGTSGQKTLLIPKLPYVQTKLHKIVLIYRNGYCTTQNINELSIKNSEEFNSEFSGQIHHHMWNLNKEFPPLGTMMQNAIHKRKTEPFFYAKTDYIGNKRLETPLRVEVVDHSGKEIFFKTTFLNENDQPPKFKYHDTIRYQYAWGLPNAYPVNEEELEPPKEEIDHKSYCIVEAETSRGPIEDFTLELRFERQCRGNERGELFSKNPIFQTGRITGSYTNWSTPRHAPKAINVPLELDMWYEIYQLHIEKFEGKVRVAWRPSSRKYNL